MSYVHPAWLEHQRKRFTRADAYRFAPPGSPEAKPPGWIDPSATRVRLKEAQEEEARARAAAEQEEFERELLQLRWEVKKLKLDHELWCLEQKYSPNQPRDDRGRWTDSGAGAQPIGPAGSSASDGVVLSDATPDPIMPGAQYAQNEPQRRPIDLREEQQLGGHAIEGHVGKSQEFLLARVRRLALDAERDGFGDGLRVGSFSSLEAANKLVSATVARNPAKVDLVTSGRSSSEELDGYFDAPTGYEAYARTERSQPYIRDTYGVRVIIVPHDRAAKGFRVDTAYPKNFGR